MQAKKGNNNAVIDNLIAHFKIEIMHKTVSQSTKVRFEKNLSGAKKLISLEITLLLTKIL